MSTTLIDQGFNLMLFGMGTVFVFLTVLIFATLAMSNIIQRLPSTQVDNAVKVNKPSTRPGQAAQFAALASKESLPINPQTLKVIQAAIEKHRCS